MSAAGTSYVGKCDVGTISREHITDKGENHYCCRWSIENKSLLEIYESDQAVKSPVFTIPDRDACKWYLIFESSFENTFIDHYFAVRLVLDRESDCKEAVAKISLSVLLPKDVRNYESHDQPCSLEYGIRFTFVTNSDNQSGVLSSYVNRTSVKSLTIVCDMMIESIIPKDEDITADFGLLLKNQLFTDVVLSVGEKKLPAHKAILATRSSVFAAMFAHDMAESKGVVKIEGMNENTVEKMLHYIYTGEVEELNDVAEDLLIAADKYDLKGLRRKCEGALIKGLSSENAFDLLLFAESYNASELKFETINFLTNRSTYLKKTSAWDHLCKSCPEPVRGLLEAVFCFKFTRPRTRIVKRAVRRKRKFEKSKVYK